MCSSNSHLELGPGLSSDILDIKQDIDELPRTRAMNHIDSNVRLRQACARGMSRSGSNSASHLQLVKIHDFRFARLETGSTKTSHPDGETFCSITDYSRLEGLSDSKH